MSTGLIILLSLIGCTFFSGLEIAFLMANKLKIELDTKQGTLSGKIFSPFVKKPSRFISAMLLGNSISIVIYGIYSEQIIEHHLANYLTNYWIIFLLKTIITTLFVLLVAEYIPKALFSLNPNKSLQIFALPFVVIYYLLFPFVWITMFISEGLINLSGAKNEHRDRGKFSRVDLDNYVNSFGSSVKIEDRDKVDHEIQIFQNALEFPNVKVRECMIPRTEIISIEIEDDISLLKEKFISTGVSKVLVYRDTIDNIIGYVHTYEMFKNPETIKSVLLPISVFPESMQAREALDNFIHERRSIGVVLDEFGGTAGLVTMEDLMEEIFGEIDDEHDKKELTELKINKTEFIFSGRLEIDYLNEKYALNLPASENYETLAGLIIHRHEDIPAVGKIIEIDNFTFTIQQVDKRRIETVKIKTNPE
ncbi:MAG: HlyC/CorC family transporter [Bacteroidia bacterium]|nr:HlyC/CorC family transporter [Bacteroidia bacterium]